MGKVKLFTASMTDNLKRGGDWPGLHILHSSASPALRRLEIMESGLCNSKVTFLLILKFPMTPTSYLFWLTTAAQVRQHVPLNSLDTDALWCSSRRALLFL